MKIVIEGNTIDGSARSTLNVVLSGARGPQGPQGEAGASEWGDIGGTLSNQTDLQSALDAKVPYTGATQDVNLGEFGLLTGNVEFDTTPTNAPTAAGSMYYDDTSGTVVNILKGGNVISKIGETQHVRVYNNTGAPITKGKVVSINGAQGQRPTIILADADSETLSKDTIGFTAEAIADGAEGFVMIAGVLTNVSTSGMVDGDTVYLSTTAGGYTNVKPDAPVHMVILGFVVNGGSGGAGQIYVKVDNGYELEELHNVKDTAKTTAVDADALLLKDSEDGNLWKPFSWLNAKAGIKAHMDTFKGVAGGYASLDGGGKVPASELPSYVDDVIEAANFAALPATGETGKIYVTLDDNKCYRWSGSVYIQVAQGIDTLTTTGTSGAATLVGSTLNIPQYQSVLTNPVTGTGTAGQVAYWNGTNTVTGSNNLFWDAVNNRLGINLINPTVAFQVAGDMRFSGHSLLDIALPNRHTITTGFKAYWPGANSSFMASTVSGYEGWILNSNLVRGTGGWVLQEITRSAWHIGALYGSSSDFFFIQRAPATSGDANLTNFLKIFSNGNTAINSGSDAGQKFQVYGSTLLRGSGTTSATTALLVQNSTPTALLTVRDDGRIQQTIPGATDNTIFGAFAGNNSSLTGSNNSFFGVVAGFANTTGADNTFIGTSSGYKNTTSSGNTFIGSLSGFNNTTGATNTFIGYQSSQSNTTGNSNNSFGYQAGFSNTTGADNTYFGRTAGAGNTTGGRNIFIGRDAGRFINDGSNNTIANNSVFIGYNTRALADSQTNQIAIGYEVIGNGSNTVTLGNTSITATYLRGNINYTDGGNFVFGTTTGTKIGTATTEKLSFWNATPIVQPTTGIAEATFVENSGGTAVNVDSTFAGYTIQQIAQALKDIGILA